MGVDFYNCAICNEIYPDCGKYDNCEGYGGSWCGECMYNGNNRKSLYDGDPYCELCEPRTTPREPTEKQLLQHIIEKYNINKEEEIIELQQTRKFQDEVTKYYCTTSENDMHGALECNSDGCEYLEHDYEMDESKYGITLERGRCCRDVYRDDQDEWCHSCLETNKKKRK